MNAGCNLGNCRLSVLHRCDELSPEASLTDVISLFLSLSFVAQGKVAASDSTSITCSYKLRDAYGGTTIYEHNSLKSKYFGTII